MTEPKNELTTIGARAPMLTRDQVLKNRDTVRQVMSGVMVKGKHYGVIPGTGDKPNLLKPGAEVLLSTFRISTTLAVEDMSDEDEIRYRVVVKGMHGPSGVDLGEGIGECSSNESKYKWRKASCQQEWDEADRDRRRVKWSTPSGGGEAYAVLQVRTEPADMANTVLKMAKKRALIDFTLTALAVSDMFSQDLEELEAELHAGDAPAAGSAGGAGTAGNASTGQQRTAGDGRKPETERPREKAQNERKGSPGAQAAKAAATGSTPSQVPVVEWRRRLDRLGYPETEFAARFDLGSLDDVALKDVAKVEQELVDIERRGGTP